MSKQIIAQVVADSRNEFGQRITTFVVEFPRIILAEFNTHRMFSRNSASSRAIPFEKMLKMVRENPFIPIAWQKDHQGMQGTEYFTTESAEEAWRDTDRAFAYSHIKDIPAIQILETEWLEARDNAAMQALTLARLGTTKQLCNRLLEPFMMHRVIVTATEFENFFHLRCPQYVFHDDKGEYIFRSKKDVIKHFGEDELVEYSTENIPMKDLTDLQWLQLNKGQAEIHAMALAEAMWDAYNESTPKQLKAGEWHIPFGDKIDESKIFEITETATHKVQWKPIIGIDEGAENFYNQQKIKIATARCARVSYLNYEGKDDYEADIKLYDRLSSSGHWSPFEHCAQAMTEDEFTSHHRGIAFYENSWPLHHEADRGWSGNFQGFKQLRKTFVNENAK